MEQPAIWQGTNDVTLADSLKLLVGDSERVLTNPQVVQRLSRDFYWYSPVLRPLLDGKTADVVVQAISEEEIRNVLRYCFAHQVPVTTRGSGTGNYGQAVPLRGGVVLDLSRFDALECIHGDGVAVCRPGIRLATLESAAGDKGWELRCYPSTIVKASLGGFLAGGSGGIGSVTHGGLRDFQTVRAVEVMTMEAEPRIIKHEGEAVHEILHAWGTNGILTKISIALTPKVNWSQCVLAFDSFEEAFTFSERVASSPDWDKRLVSTFEWPIPSFFQPIMSMVERGKSLVFVMVAAHQLSSLMSDASLAGGQVMFFADVDGFRTTPLLSDFTWNHTTLWAIRADPAYTYLQCGFDPREARQQFAALKHRFGDDILFHIEFMKRGDGFVVPGAIPIVRYSTRERLDDMISFCREIGISVANPHVNHVEGGGRYREDNLQLLAKQRYDPEGLLNPGKMATFSMARVGRAAE